MSVKYKDWLEEWLAYYVRPATKERTYTKYATQTQHYLAPLLGDYDMGALSAYEIQKFSVALVDSGLATNTINGIVSVLKLSIKRAAALGKAKRDCLDGLVLPKTQAKQVECFTLQEQRKMEEYIAKSKNHKLFGVLFCLYTGLRIGELLALTWQDIDLKKGVFTVSKTCMDSWHDGQYVKIILPPKTSSSNRVIPLPKQLLPRIKELKKGQKGEYFIVGQGRYGAQIRSYQKTFGRMLNKLELPHRGFHSLRHTFATRALECGMDVKTLAEILGHKNPTVTLNRYAHSLMEHKACMMNKVGKLLMTACAPRANENEQCKIKYEE